MSRFFYNLGRKVGPRIRKAKWMWQSITGTEADVIAAEYDLGRDLAVEIRRHLQPDPDADSRKLLSEIGSCLAARVANKLRKFNFEPVKGGEPNAFAIPGGFVFVTRSMLELCGWNPDQIAFILGHEMAHIIHGHATDRIISNSAIAAASRAAPARGVLTTWLRRVGVQFLESAYAQDLETEADKLGARLTIAAGYDHSAPIQLLSRLSKVSSATDQFNLGSYFSSHPPFNVRIQNLNRLLRRRQSQQQD